MHICDLAYQYYAQHISYHAWTRMGERGISPAEIDLVLEYGRPANVRGAEVYAIGRKEVARWRKHGINLSFLEGVQVICSHDNGSVITLYRNRQLPGLKSRYSRRYAPSHASARPVRRHYPL